MQGEVIWFSIHDLGGEVDLARVGKVLDESPAIESVEIAKTAPRYVEFPRPLVLRLPAESHDTTVGPVTFDVQVRLFSLGVASVLLRAPVDVPDLASLTPYGALKLAGPDGERPLTALARGLVARVREAIPDAIVEPYAVDTEPEPYVVYALRDLAPFSVADLWTKERRAIAGLLGGEPHAHRLADEEVEDNLTHWYRYYADELVVVDWESALVVEPRGKWQDVLTVIELANVQLLELRTYDRYLDGVLARAYDDLNRFYGRGGLFRSARGLQQDLSEARIDLTRVTDAVHNAAKIHGDWFLAKLHAGLQDRFHLAGWERGVHEKLTTLNELYALATHEVEHRRAVVLEGMIVLLFVIDLALIAVLSK